MDIGDVVKLIRSAVARPDPEAVAFGQENDEEFARWAHALIRARRRLRETADDLMEFSPRLQDELNEAARGLPDSPVAYQFLLERAEDCARRWGVCRNRNEADCLDRARIAYLEAATMVG